MTDNNESSGGEGDNSSNKNNTISPSPAPSLSSTQYDFDVTTSATSPSSAIKQRQQLALKRHLNRNQQQQQQSNQQQSLSQKLSPSSSTPKSLTGSSSIKATSPLPSSTTTTTNKEYILEVHHFNSTTRVHLGKQGADMSVLDMKRIVGDRLSLDVQLFKLKAAGYELKDTWIGREFGMDKSPLVKVEVIIKQSSPRSADSSSNNNNTIRKNIPSLNVLTTSTITDTHSKPNHHLLSTATTTATSTTTTTTATATTSTSSPLPTPPITQLQQFSFDSSFETRSLSPSIGNTTPVSAVAPPRTSNLNDSSLSLEDKIMKLTERKLKQDRELLRAKEANEKLKEQHENAMNDLKLQMERKINQLQLELLSTRQELEAVRLGAKTTADAFMLEKERLLLEINNLKKITSSPSSISRIRAASDDVMPIDEFARALSLTKSSINSQQPPKSSRNMEKDGIALCFACPAWMLTSITEDEEDYFEGEDGSAQIHDTLLMVNQKQFIFDAAIGGSIERLAVAIESFDAWDAVLEDKSSFSLVLIGEQCTDKRLLLAGRGGGSRKSSTLGQSQISPRLNMNSSPTNSPGDSPRSSSNNNNNSVAIGSHGILPGTAGLMELLMIKLFARISSYSAESSGAFSCRVFCSLIHVNENGQLNDALLPVSTSLPPPPAPMFNPHHGGGGGIIGATSKEIKSVSDFSRIIVSKVASSHTSTTTTTTTTTSMPNIILDGNHTTDNNHAASSSSSSDSVAIRLIIVEIKSSDGQEVIGCVQFLVLNEDFTDVESLRSFFGKIDEKNRIAVCVCLHPGMSHAEKSAMFADRSLQWAKELVG
jgi:hypothetical protein